jgi:hypothetical protein
MRAHNGIHAVVLSSLCKHAELSFVVDILIRSFVSFILCVYLYANGFLLFKCCVLFIQATNC